MLGIGKLGVGQVDYYLSSVAQGLEDYYLGTGEAPGEWMGKGAARLGLSGRVVPENLRAVLDGMNPTTGERVAGRRGHTRVPGWDLTFSAPKSVSVLYGLGGPEVAGEVVEAHRHAVTEALGWLEAHATVSRRRLQGTIEQVRGEGLVVGAFRHRTSRAGDPQLHTHCLAANLVEHVDGGSGALHSPPLYRQARTAGFVYQAVLRGELTERLGLRWDPVHNGYAEVGGIDRAVLEAFSKRRAEIDEVLAERGEDSARAAQMAALATRAAKDYGVDAATLTQRWEAEAAELGFGPEAIAALVGASPVVVTPTQLDAVIEEMTSAQGLTAQQASFERSDVARAWCAALPPGTVLDRQALDELVTKTLADPRTVAVLDGHTGLESHQVTSDAHGQLTSALTTARRWSTTEMLGTEQRLLDQAVALVGHGAGRVDEQLVRARLDQRPELSPEQAAMVQRLTTSGHGVELVVGVAGAGKTYALAAAAQVWRDGHYRPLGVALAAKAAAGLQASAGIPSTTVAQFLIDCDRFPTQVLNHHDIVVLDEAAMVDTRRLARVAAHVVEAGAKLVLVGDDGQLPAIEAGGAFAGLVNRLGANPLTENRRQVECWERHTLSRLRAGDRTGIDEVIETYDRHDRLHLGPTPGDVRAAMVTDWFGAGKDWDQAVMVALRRADVAELNARARALLVQEGQVASEGLTVAVGNRAGEAVGERTFAVGDRVVCLANDHRLGVHNALFARVTAVADDGALALTTAEDQTKVIPARYAQAGHLDHGYAATIHKSQGDTFARLLFLGDDRLYRQAAYTALSRGRDRNDFYLVIDDDRDRDLDPHGRAPEDSPLTRLARVLGRDGAKVMALDEHDRGAGPEVPTVAPLSQLWRHRDALAAALTAEEPPDRGPALAFVTGAASVAEARAAQASLIRAAAEEAAQARRPLWRRTEVAAAERTLAHALRREATLLGEWGDLDDQRTELEAAQEQRTVWLAANQRDLARLGALDQAVARRMAMAGRAAELQRPPDVLAVIGEPPVGLEGRERWREAAGAIESYRARWGADPAVIIDEPVASPEQAGHLQAVVVQAELVTGAAVDLDLMTDARAGLELG